MKRSIRNDWPFFVGVVLDFFKLNQYLPNLINEFHHCEYKILFMRFR